MFIVDVKNRIVMPVPYTDSNEAEMHTDFLNRMCGTNNYQVWQSWYEKEADEICSDAQKITYAQMVAERQKLNKPLRNHIITRDNSICQICGKPVSGSDLHIDHITPISKGGLTEESNLQVLCAACNIKKSNN